MKRIASFILLFSLICLQFAATAQALTAPGHDNTEPSTDPIILCDTYVHDDLYGTNTKEVQILQEGESLITNRLSDMYYLDTNGKVHLIPIDWDITDESLLEPGFHSIYGTPVLEENISLAEGFEGIVTWPMFRIGGGETMTVIPVQEHLVSDRIIGEGSSDPESEVSISTKNRYCFVGDDGFIRTTTDWIWSWDFSQVNTNSTGSATITGTLTDLPSYITVPDKSKTVTHTVYVMPNDRIELYAPVETMKSGQLVFEWYYDCSNVTDINLERLNNNGEWTTCENRWYSYKSPSMFASAKLHLNLQFIPANSSYTFRLSYKDTINNETVQRYTEPISITIPENIMELIANANGGVPDTLNIGGDRDGGDSGGTVMPDYQQPAPKPERTEQKDKNNTTPEPVKEVVTDTYSAISGLRLDELIAAGNTVLFEKQGVSVEIPSDILEALNLGDDDLLEVTIQRPQTNAVQLSISAAGVPVNDLKGTVIYMPWKSSDGTELECHDLDGNIIGKVTYNEAQGIARFVVNAPGTYLLSAAVETKAEEKSQTETVIHAPKEDKNTVIPDDTENNYVLPVGIAVCVIAVLLLAVFFFRRRRHHD